VRFFRLAEQRIAEKTGKGVVCYISNFSYLSDPSFVVMRQRFLSEFDQLWFDCMNGDSRETGKLTPEGKPDPSVFSTEYNREGIRLGTSISLLVRQPKRSQQPKVLFRDFWGKKKRTDVLASLNTENFDAQYETVSPDKSNRYSFRFSNVSSQYLEWLKLVDLCAESPSNGLMEKRGSALIDIDKDALEKRMQMYYDTKVDWETLKALGTGLTKNAAGFEPKKVRAKVLAAEAYNQNQLRRYALRPFETRWCYYSDISTLWNRSRPALWAQCWEGNSFLMSRPAGVANPEGVPFFFTRVLGDNDFQRGHSYYFPFRLQTTQKQKGKKNSEPDTLFNVDNLADTTLKANLSQKARDYFTQLGITNPDADADTAGLIWMHALAIGYSPAYLSENADGIRQDWPRIPLPNSRELLFASAELGKQVAALLDTENPVAGVTQKVRSELKAIALISRVGSGNINPDSGELAITAGWGYAGSRSVTMPGKGKVVERPYTSQEKAAIKEGATALGLTTEQAMEQLGNTTCDIYLNDTAYWKNLPTKVWNYTIGGYQVIKKWLSYREEKLLGRSLKKEEVREVSNMARRISAILLLETELDKNYQLIKQSTYSFD
jgi:hypothetical protein